MTSQSQRITASLGQGVPQLQTVAWERDVQEEQLERLQTWIGHLRRSVEDAL